jgi:hypothetical protein
MAEHDINKSRHLLKRLEGEMIFLSSIMSQMESLSSQVNFVSSGIRSTWVEISKLYKGWEQNQEEEI